MLSYDSIVILLSFGLLNYDTMVNWVCFGVIQVFKMWKLCAFKWKNQTRYKVQPLFLRHPGFEMSKCANNSPSTIYPLTCRPTRSLLSTGKCIHMKPIGIGSGANTNLCKGLRVQALALINTIPLARGRWPRVYRRCRTRQGCLSLYWRPSTLRCVYD